MIDTGSWTAITIQRWQKKKSTYRSLVLDYKLSETSRPLRRCSAQVASGTRLPGHVSLWEKICRKMSEGRVLISIPIQTLCEAHHSLDTLTHRLKYQGLKKYIYPVNVAMQYKAVMNSSV